MQIDFLAMLKVGNVGIFVLLKFENKLDKSIPSILIRRTMTSVNLLLKLISLLTVPNLAQLEAVQKSQLCVLWGHSSVNTITCSYRIHFLRQTQTHTQLLHLETQPIS